MLTNTKKFPGVGTMNKLNRIFIVALIGLVLPAGLALAQDSNYEFGVTPFFKNYPEFKRGFDPYANLRRPTGPISPITTIPPRPAPSNASRTRAAD